MSPIDLEAFNTVVQAILVIIAMGCATGVITSFFKHRRFKGGQAPDIAARFDDLSERLARLDTAVDSVAIEIERISEAQRFTSKLLAERAGTPALPERARAGGSTTPH